MTRFQTIVVFLLTLTTAASLGGLIEVSIILHHVADLDSFFDHLRELQNQGTY